MAQDGDYAYLRYCQIKRCDTRIFGCEGGLGGSLLSEWQGRADRIALPRSGCTHRPSFRRRRNAHSARRLPPGAARGSFVLHQACVSAGRRRCARDRGRTDRSSDVECRSRQGEVHCGQFGRSTRARVLPADLDRRSHCDPWEENAMPFTRHPGAACERSEQAARGRDPCTSQLAVGSGQSARDRRARPILRASSSS
jgi:hypothetical protein